MPASASAPGSASVLNCGLWRERGTVRTSTSNSTRCAASITKRSASERLECPMVSMLAVAKRHVDAQDALAAGESVEGAVEGVMFGYTVAIEVGKRAQGKPIIDAFAQLAVIPVLDTHENERAQGLRGGDSIAAGVGALQPPHQILAHVVDQGGMVVQESQDALQEGVEVDGLMAQFEIGEAELRWGEAAHTIFSG